MSSIGNNPSSDHRFFQYEPPAAKEKEKDIEKEENSSSGTLQTKKVDSAVNQAAQRSLKLFSSANEQEYVQRVDEEPFEPDLDTLTDLSSLSDEELANLTPEQIATFKEQLKIIDTADSVVESLERHHENANEEFVQIENVVNKDRVLAAQMGKKVKELGEENDTDFLVFNRIKRNDNSAFSKVNSLIKYDQDSGEFIDSLLQAFHALYHPGVQEKSIVNISFNEINPSIFELRRQGFRAPIELMYGFNALEDKPAHRQHLIDSMSKGIAIDEIVRQHTHLARYDLEKDSVQVIAPKDELHHYNPEIALSININGVTLHKKVDAKAMTDAQHNQMKQAIAAFLKILTEMILQQQQKKQTKEKVPPQKTTESAITSSTRKESPKTLLDPKILKWVSNEIGAEAVTSILEATRNWDKNMIKAFQRQLEKHKEIIKEDIRKGILTDEIIAKQQNSTTLRQPEKLSFFNKFVQEFYESWPQ